MDIQEYIDSGILELYCLGSLTEEERASVEEICHLYPQIKAELSLIELALENYADANAIAPRHNQQENIAGLLLNISKESQMEAENLPIINKYSDHKKWLSYVEELLPQISETGLSSHILRNTDGVMQALVVSSVDINNEVHINEQESFLILKGECECKVGDDVFRLKAGGYASIPLHEMHNVKVLSPYVVAILQHVEV